MVEQIAQDFKEDNPDLFGQERAVQQRLFSYAQEIELWAYEVSDVMLKRVARADYTVWNNIGQKLSAETRKRLKDVTVSSIFQQLQREQVDLIKSLPIEAAEKVHEWTQKGLSTGERYPAIAKRIRENLGQVTETRAIVIARTETARTRSNFTQARAQAVGSTHYIWHTVGDGTVRDTHARLNGKVFAWDDPPISDYGKNGEPIRAHPGCIWNCRCYASPIFEEKQQ